MSITRVIPFVVISLTAPLAASRAETPGLEPIQHAMHAPDLPPGLVEKVREATAQFREQPPPGYDQFLGVRQRTAGRRNGYPFRQHEAGRCKSRSG
jgi:hypothetical protein